MLWVVSLHAFCGVSFAQQKKEDARSRDYAEAAKDLEKSSKKRTSGNKNKANRTYDVFAKPVARDNSDFSTAKGSPATAAAAIAANGGLTPANGVMPEPQAPPKGRIGDKGPEQGALLPRAETQWEEILDSPRIGGRFTAVAVDPQNPNRVFVGTEEGTIVKSTDGGVTWTEYEVTPFIVQDRTIGIFPPPKPDPADVQSPVGYSFFIDPPFSIRPERLSIPFDTNFMSIKPDFIKTGFFPAGPKYYEKFFEDAVKSRRKYTNPVNRITLCPGSRYPIVVSTLREVWGSDDDGRTFNRIYTVLNPGKVYHAVCDARYPNDMMINSDFGIFHSEDGGLTYETLVLGRGEAVGSSAVYMPLQPNEKVHVAAIADDFVYHGDPTNHYKRLKYIYPDWSELDTAPWAHINWGAIDSEGRLWWATQDGLRASTDNTYKHWSTVDTALFNKQKIEQVMLGSNDKGGDRMAIVMKEWVLATDDGGKHFFIFFYADSRREFRQIASAPFVPGIPPRWWVITSGQLFASVRPRYVTGGTIDHETARWAAKKLALTPSFEDIVLATWNETRLSPQWEHSITDSMKNRNWIPFHTSLYLQLESLKTSKDFRTTSISVSPSGSTDIQAYTKTEQFGAPDFLVFLQAIWELRDTILVTEQLTPIRNSIAQMRRFERDLVQDAWHERMLLLARLAEGMDDPIQIHSMRDRIESLDAVLELWTRQSLPKLYLALKMKRQAADRKEKSE